MGFLKDPCGIVCLLITYLAVLYADYVVLKFILLTLENSIWGSFHVICFNTVIFLLGMSHMKAVFLDPGVVPLPQTRLDFSDLHSNEKGIYDNDSDWTVCTRCETYRPPRAHHCKICQRCIRKLDHHCPWINNCVGERNQKYFLQFLVYVGILSLYSIALVIMSWVYPCEECDLSLADSQAKMLHSVVLLLESALFGLFVCAIMVDQLHAILYDETAIEAVQLRGPYRHNRPKLLLMAEVCGKGHPLLWFFPCTGINRKFHDTPLLNHEV